FARPGLVDHSSGLGPLPAAPIFLKPGNRSANQPISGRSRDLMDLSLPSSNRGRTSRANILIPLTASAWVRKPERPMILRLPKGPALRWKSMICRNTVQRFMIEIGGDLRVAVFVGQACAHGIGSIEHLQCDEGISYLATVKGSHGRLSSDRHQSPRMNSIDSGPNLLCCSISGWWLTSSISAKRALGIRLA